MVEAEGAAYFFHISNEESKNCSTGPKPPENW